MLSPICRPLETTTKAANVTKVVNDLFVMTGLIWNKLEGVCMNGGPNMLGSRSGLVTFVKQKQPNVRGTHCMIHREALASKTLPKNLHADLIIIISIVNYVKGSVFFHELCKDMDAEHTALLFHTQVLSVKMKYAFLSTTAPDIEALISNKQFQSSH